MIIVFPILAAFGIWGIYKLGRKFKDKDENLRDRV